MVFPEINVVDEVVAGIVNVTQGNGMAGIASNTVLLGWPDDLERRAAFLQVMVRLERLKKSLSWGASAPPPFPTGGDAQHRHLVGRPQRNGDLMLLLAYLLTRNPDWREATVGC